MNARRVVAALAYESRIVSKYMGLHAMPEKESQGINEDGFSRAGFACQQVQPGRELYRQVIYDRVVLEPQFDEHRRPGTQND